MNTGGTGPLSRQMVDSITGQYRAAMEGGPDIPSIKGPISEEFEKARGTVADFFGVTPEEIAMLRSISEGLSTVAYGMDWNPGDEVIVTEEEHPTGIMVWLNLEKERGIKIRRMPLPGGIEPHTHIGIPVPEKWAGRPEVFTQPPAASMRAAAFGGVTTLLDFAGTLPVTPDDPVSPDPIMRQMESRRQAFSGHSYIDFAYHYILAGAVGPQTIGEIGEARERGQPVYGEALHNYLEFTCDDYSIWEGFECEGYPVKTVLRGKVIVEDGKLVGSSSDGEWLPRKVSPETLARPVV